MNRGLLGIIGGAALSGAIALGVGCGNSTVDFGTGGAGSGGASNSSSSSGAASTSTSSSGTVSSSSSGATSSSSGSTTTSSSSSSTAASSGATSTSSSSGGGGCSFDPADSACLACSKQQCCAELVPCQNDPACVCWTGCLAQNPNNPAACAGCGPYDNTTQTFVNCAAGKCGQECTGTVTTSSSSSGGACAPATGDSACTSCAKQKCCNQVTACTGSATCVCWVTCLANGGSITGCFGTCGAPDNVTNQLSNCSLQQCPGMCP